AMNSIFSSDITPETIAKLEREQSQLQEKKDELPKLEFELSKLEMYADAYIKNTRCMVQLRTQIDHLTQELDRLKRQPSKIEEIKIYKIKFWKLGWINFELKRAEIEMNKFENSLANSERKLEELNNEIENITKEIQQKANVA
ncbi:15563_t:CDS:2, partial [Funneliformis geosporum]